MGWEVRVGWWLCGALLLGGCGPEQASRADARGPEDSLAKGDAGAGNEGGAAPDARCQWGMDEVAVEPISPRSDRSYGLSSFGNQLELVWTLSGCGLPGRGMRRLSVSSDEPATAPKRWPEDDGCQWRKHPALLQYADPSSEGGYALDAFYAGHVGDGFVPMRKPLEPDAAARPVTNVQGEYWDARGLSVALLHGEPLLAWVGAAPGETEETGRAMYVQRVRVEATPQTLVEGEQGQRAEDVALAAMGGDDGAGAAVAWASHAEGAAGGIFLTALDADGTAAGTPRRLLAANGAASEVALAGHPDGGGALAYVVDFDDEGAHVRLQPLDAQARVDGRARRITSASLYAHDVSVASFGPGFVLAYRLVSPQDDVEARIQLAFTDSSGNPIGRLDVAAAQPSGGPTSVATTLDGSVAVTWVDITDAGALLRLWRGSCQ